MKILVFSDIHGSNNLIRKIQKESKKADLLICAGDFTFFSHDIENIFNKITKLNKKVIVIHGNHEDLQYVKQLSKNKKNVKFLHKKIFRYNDYLFYGYGGGGFSFIDLELDRQALKLKQLIKKDQKLIFITHAPPYRTKTDKLAVGHQGSNSVRKFIEELKPILHIHGHFHETENIKDKIGNTLIVNAAINPKLLKSKI